MAKVHATNGQKTRWSYQLRIKWLGQIVGQSPKVSPADMWIATRQHNQLEATFKSDLLAHEKAMKAGTTTADQAPIPPPAVTKSADQMRDEVTVEFPRDRDGKPMIKEIQIKGALKAAAGAIGEKIGVKGAYLVNEFIRIDQHEFPLPDGTLITTEVMTIEVFEVGKAPDSVVRIAEVADVTSQEMEVIVHVLGDRITASQLEALAREAGLIGVGGSRKQGGYGKYELIGFEEIV